jgi:RNA-dependent RNA polymerase
MDSNYKNLSCNSGALYLNRQGILLLSSRGIPESHFLVLQNENHLWLVQALLCSSVAFELLNDRVGSTCFNFRDIANAFNLVEEPFFLQLIITCGHDCVSKFQQRAKIKTAKNKARNMFGIVDEYGVLEYEQVFIQYTIPREDKLYSTKEERMKNDGNQCEIYQGEVVVTKNPCHHPGDLRRFQAVYHPKLRHLKDVIVFPQKGPRPHPNEISGSDLDGWY